MVKKKSVKTSVRNSMKYGGFWVRFIALILDSLIIGAVISILSFGVRRGDSFTTGVGIVISWLYFSLMESSNLQATVGKIVLGLKVVNRNGKRISFPRATGRYFSKYLSVIIIFIGFIMVAFTKKKQGLHDKIADTLVVKK